MDDSRTKILILVSGMSPQIITETLYALCVQSNPEWIPDEVHLITTGHGRDNAVLQLLEDKKRFHQFLQDYNIVKPIRFDESTIHLIKDNQMNDLPDLRTPEDNEAAADTISAVIRKFARNADTELHVSLAGGRKTMGFYAGYALSLFGRPQDCLSHVLVSEHYESNSEFYYPTPYRKEITHRDGRSLDARQAQVWLARIPFVRLRSGLPESLLNGNHGFSETVELARRATERVIMRFWPCERRYEVNDVPGKLSTTHAALLLWIVVHLREKGEPVRPLSDGYKELGQEYGESFINIAQRYGVSLSTQTEALMRKGMDKGFIETNVSRLNLSMKKNLGPDLAERCKLASRRLGKLSGYGVPEDLDIEIMEGDVP
ncbi:MAG: CRISPR-associated ring nuclease Csm6 [Pseudohongiella sp.]|nr:CRISPR-associated ring nuclease Csm6 [Pseudohongiella sp.]